MQLPSTAAADSTPETRKFAPEEMAELIDKQEREIVRLRRQVEWFQRQIFGQKSERRLPEPEGAQGTLGESFDAVPDATQPNKKTRVAGHEREHKPKNPVSADESTLFFADNPLRSDLHEIAGRRNLGAG